MSDIAIGRPAHAPTKSLSIYLLAFALLTILAALNFSLVLSKTKERCDTRPGPFSSGFNTGFQKSACTCNRYFSFAEACPTPATLLPLDFSTGM
jgi:hypothetical protein